MQNLESHYSHHYDDRNSFIIQATDQCYSTEYHSDECYLLNYTPLLLILLGIILLSRIVEVAIQQNTTLLNSIRQNPVLLGLYS